MKLQVTLTFEANIENVSVTLKIKIKKRKLKKLMKILQKKFII